MSAARDELLSLVLSAAQRSVQKDWAINYAGERLSREDAVQQVVSVLKDQLGAPLPENGPGVDLVIGQASFSDYFSTSTPTDDEIGIMIERARSDYYAYQALGYLSQITSHLRSDILVEWERRRRLGLVLPPRKPCGPSPHKYAHKEMLVVSQIRQLEVAGFKPTRNSAAKKHNSGCDIVAEAMQRLGEGMVTYDAIEKIWKKRKSVTPPKLIANLFAEGLLKQLDEQAKPSD